MTPNHVQENTRSARMLLAILGLLFAILALWAWMDAAQFSAWTLPGCGLLAALFLGLARWATDRWVQRVRGLLTGWP